jgi:hypothetical protein
VQISFDDMPHLEGRSHEQRRMAWERSRRLQHGTLVTLWSEGAAGPTSPCLLTAVIAKRDLTDLAPKDPRDRPSICIR